MAFVTETVALLAILTRKTTLIFHEVKADSQILLGIPKQNSWLDNDDMADRLPVWGVVVSSAFQEIFEIAKHELRDFTKLPNYLYPKGR